MGLVFPIPTGTGGNMSSKRIIRYISAIGAKAGVVTNPERGKTATSHDIGRRGFLPKIDSKLTMPEAHKAMGHAKFQTTVDYYDTRTMASITAKLWGDRTPEK